MYSPYLYESAPTLFAKPADVRLRYIRFCHRNPDLDSSHTSTALPGSKEPAASARDAAAQAAEKRWQEKNAAAEQPVDAGEGSRRQRRGNGWVAPKKGVAGDRAFVDLDASPGKEGLGILGPGSKPVPPRQSGDGKPTRAKREEVNLVDSTPITKFFRKREGPAEEGGRKVPRLDLSTPESKGGNDSKGLAGFGFEGKGMKPVVDGEGWELFPSEKDVGTAERGNGNSEQNRAGDDLVRAPSEDALAHRRKTSNDGEAGLDTTTTAQAGSPLAEGNGVDERDNDAGSAGRGSEGSDQDGDVSEEESDPEWTEGMRNKRMKWERKTRGRRRKKGGKRVVREESDSEDLLELDPRPKTKVGSGAKRDRCAEGEDMEWENEEGGKNEPEKQGGIRKYFLRKGTAQGGNTRDKAPDWGAEAIDLDEDAEAEQGAGTMQYARKGKKRKRSLGKDTGVEKPVIFQDPDWRGVERYGVLQKHGIGVADVGDVEVNWQRRVQWMGETMEEGDWEGRLDSKRQRRVEPGMALSMGETDAGNEPTQEGQVSGEKRGEGVVGRSCGSGLQRGRSDVFEEMGAMRLDSFGPVAHEQTEPGGVSRKRLLSEVSQGDRTGGAEKSASETESETEAEQSTDSGNEESQAEANIKRGERLSVREETRTRGAKLTAEELQAALRSSLDDEAAELDVVPAAETQGQGYGSGGHNRSRRVLALSSQETLQSGDAGDVVQKAGVPLGVLEPHEEPSEEPVTCPLCQKRFPAGTNDETVNAHANQCLDQGTV